MTNKIFVLETLEEIFQKRDLPDDERKQVNGLTALYAGYRLESYDDPACINRDTNKPYRLWRLISPDGTDLSNHEARYSQDHALEDAPDFCRDEKACFALPLEKGYVWQILFDPHKPMYIADILTSGGKSSSYSWSKKRLAIAMVKAWWCRPKSESEPVFTECPRCNGAMEDGVCTFCGNKSAHT